MSKYKRHYTVKLRTAHYISYSLRDGPTAAARRPRAARHVVDGYPREFCGQYMEDHRRPLWEAERLSLRARPAGNRRS